MIVKRKMSFEERGGKIKLFVVGLAVSAVLFDIIGIISPGWYIFESKTDNFILDKFVADKILVDQTTSQAPRARRQDDGLQPKTGEQANIGNGGLGGNDRNSDGSLPIPPDSDTGAKPDPMAVRITKLPMTTPVSGRTGMPPGRPTKIPIGKPPRPSDTPSRITIRTPSKPPDWNNNGDTKPLVPKRSTKVPLKVRTKVPGGGNGRWTNMPSRWPGGIPMKKRPTIIPNPANTDSVAKRMQTKVHIVGPTGFSQFWSQVKSGMGRLDKLLFVKGLEFSVHVGLWFGKLCIEFDKGQNCSSEKLSTLFSEIRTPDVSMATWNDLRIESVFALISGVVGLVGTILTVKPFCLKTKPRLPLITAILGMILSCILFLVTISRIANIHINVNEILESKPFPTHLNTPWAVVLCGIGAGLAFATALTLSLCTWIEERAKWRKFDTDVDLAKHEAKEETYTDISDKNVAESSRI